jgi:hypothetical protein
MKIKSLTLLLQGEVNLQFKSLKKGNEIYKFKIKELEHKKIISLIPEIFFLVTKERLEEELLVTLLSSSGYYKKITFNAKSDIYLDFELMEIFTTNKNIDKSIFIDFIESLIYQINADLKPILYKKQLLEKIRMNIES